MRRLLALFLAALSITLAGCATAPSERVSVSATEEQQYVADALRSVNRITAPMPLDMVADVEPSDDTILSSILQGFTQDEWMPQSERGPPVDVAISATTHHSPKWVFPAANPSFVAGLQTTLVPDFSVGSGTPTFTRASTAYVFGYGPAAVLGVDSPIALLLNSGEAGFVGARRISANNWSGTDANGVALTTTNGASAAYGDAGGPFGYFSGGARADVLGTTTAIRRTMSDVGWIATNMTVATTLGIDGGAATGARLTATGANATILFTPGLAGAVRTYSAWIKRITGVGAVSMTVDVADGYVAKTLTAAYAQYQVTSSSAVPVVGFKIATSGDVIDVDFNTLEAATFANPTPIPVNVSKAADVLTYPSAGNVGTANTLYGEFNQPVATGATGFLLEISTDGNNRMQFYKSSSELFSGGGLNGGVLQADQSIAGTMVGSAIVKGAGFFATNNVNIFKNGTAGTLDTSATMPTYTTIRIGNDDAGTSQPFGTIRNVRIWPVALSSPRLILQTTDATDWLGSPFWRMAANDAEFRLVANK